MTPDQKKKLKHLNQYINNRNKFEFLYTDLGETIIAIGAAFMLYFLLQFIKKHTTGAAFLEYACYMFITILSIRAVTFILGFYVNVIKKSNINQQPEKLEQNDKDQL